MNRSEFEQALRALVRQHEAEPHTRGCVQCTGCERCVDCTFCRDGRELVRCHYCVELRDSIDCTHCRASEGLSQCNHCTSSERCSQSAYLSYCLDCTRCHYCLGCVGLSGAEFRVLNEPVDRTTFFRLSAELGRLLGTASWATLVGSAVQGRK
jgi:hypothetical protein